MWNPRAPGAFALALNMARGTGTAVASEAADGPLSRMKGEVKFVEKLSDKALDILSKRSGTSVRTIKNKCRDGKDWWLDADEAMKFGFCDRVE